MEHNLKNYCGVGIEDNHGLTNLYEVIDELEQFINQFSTHAMSDERLVLIGRKEAYEDVLEYLKRIAPKGY